MASIHTMSQEETSRAMLLGLESHVRAALRQRFEVVANAVIDEAVEAAMKTFEPSVRYHFNTLKHGGAVEVLLRDQRSKGRADT